MKSKFRPAIIKAFAAFSIIFLPKKLLLNYIIVDIVEKVSVILVNPITINGAIRYPTNKHTIGANPIALPINPFLDSNFSFDCFLFS